MANLRTDKVTSCDVDVVGSVDRSPDQCHDLPSLSPHPLTGHVGQQSDPIDLWTPHIHIIRQGKDRFCRTVPLSLLPMVIYHVISA